MIEQWRDVVGYEGSYEVSNLGNVRSLDREFIRTDGKLYRRRGQIIRQFPRKHGGHPAVSLTQDGRLRNFTVHRLVLAAFVSPAPPGKECCHRDGDHNNNQVSNLRWGTRSENLYDQVRHRVHINAQKTHCINGHAFTPENTRIRNRAGGGRSCRECDNNRNVAS
jgi:hypothetical protein